MVEYKDRLSAAMERKKVKRTALANALEVSYVAIKKVLDGDTKSLTAANNAKAAAFLEVSPDWLATGEGDMVPAGGKVEASNVTAMPAPAPRGLGGVLTELQTVVDGLSPLLQDAGRNVLHKWLDGQASRSDVVATLEGLQQASTGTMPGAENRAA